MKKEFDFQLNVITTEIQKIDQQIADKEEKIRLWEKDIEILRAQAVTRLEIYWRLKNLLYVYEKGQRNETTV